MSVGGNYGGLGYLDDTAETDELYVRRDDYFSPGQIGTYDTSTGDFSVLPPGANGTVLTARPALSNGLAWETPSSLSLTGAALGGAATAGSGLVFTPSTITGAGTIALAASGVAAATYGSATQVPVVTYDAAGRATGVINTAISPITINTASPLAGGGAVSPGGTLNLTVNTSAVLDSIPTENFKAASLVVVNAGAAGGVAIGHEAYLMDKSVSVGRRTGAAAGSANVAIGWEALYRCTGASGVVAVGHNCVQAPVPGTLSGVVSIGASCTPLLQANNNTSIGANANAILVGGADNTAVGYSCGVVSSGLTNTTVVGSAATASANGAVSIGKSATASGISSISVGLGADSSGDTSVAIGAANAGGVSSVAIGGASSAGLTSVAVGSSSSAQGANSIAIGTISTGSGAASIAIGNNTFAAADALALCTSSNASGASAIAIGLSSSATAINSISIGNAASAAASSAVAIGSSASVAADSLALSRSATATGVRAQAIGALSGALSDESIAVGYQASVPISSDASIAIGKASSATGANAIAIGSGCVNTTAGTALIGNSTTFIVRSAGFLKSNAWYSCKAGRSSGTQTVTFPGPVTLTINNTVWSSGCAVSGNNITMPEALTQFTVSACVIFNAIIGAGVGTIVMRIRYYDGATTTTLTQCTLTTTATTPAGASWCCSGTLQTPNVTTAYVFVELERLAGSITSIDTSAWSLTVKRDA